MTISAVHIRMTLAAYLDAHPEEKPEFAAVWDLLDAEVDLTTRKEFRGHVTAGAILTNPSGRILFIHHLALGRWLTPGGHLEPEDTTLVGAALRELTEETGIDPRQVTSLSDQPIHIDIHPIPANPARGEPDHQHIDFRYLFTTTADIGPLQAEEVTDAAWRSIDTLNNERLRTRLASVRDGK